MKIWIGNDLTKAGDPLSETTVQHLFRAITNEHSKLKEEIERLRILASIDIARYRKMKTSLPYLVCAHFRPAVRKKENFLSTQSFILDLDHIAAAGAHPDQIAQRVKDCPNLMLLFRSPSGDGLKLLFPLHAPLTDASLYAAFYKNFALQFATQYQLESLVDFKTHDVARCCFVSHDPHAQYFPDASPVVWEEYVNRDGFFDDAYQTEQQISQLKEQSAGVESGPKPSREPSKAVINEIRERMMMRQVKEKPAKEVIQPEELKVLVAKVEELLQEINLRLKSAKPISYGRQVRIEKTEQLWAELNLFYGQRGITVVGTTKSGSNKELCKMLQQYLTDHLPQYLDAEATQ